jgi:hypothetical protein
MSFKDPSLEPPVENPNAPKPIRKKGKDKILIQVKVKTGTT